MILAVASHIHKARLAQGAGAKKVTFFTEEYLGTALARGLNWGADPKKVDNVLKMQVSNTFNNLVNKQSEGVPIFSGVYKCLVGMMQEGTAQEWLDGLLAGGTAEGDVATHAEAGAATEQFISLMADHFPPVLGKLCNRW